MIELDEQEGAYLEMCKHFRAIFDTKKVQGNPEEKRMVRYIIRHLHTVDFMATEMLVFPSKSTCNHNVSNLTKAIS